MSTLPLTAGIWILVAISGLDLGYKAWKDRQNEHNAKVVTLRHEQMSKQSQAVTLWDQAVTGPLASDLKMRLRVGELASISVRTYRHSDVSWPESGRIELSGLARLSDQGGGERHVKWKRGMLLLDSGTYGYTGEFQFEPTSETIKSTDFVRMIWNARTF
jgi:hypothetical protein